MSITDLDEALVQAIRQDAFADGVDTERQRIIKLLEDEYSELIEGLGIVLVKAELDLLLKLIALIKGENNG